VKYLVTGAGGFIGWHMVDRLTRDGHSVTAWLRATVDHWPGREVCAAAIDVTDARAVAVGLAAAEPDVIVHLAAQSLPMRSWAEPSTTMGVNIGGTLNLLEAVRAAPARPIRILFAGSSGQYGSSTDGSPIGEDFRTEPGSPYAVSKLAADHCARLYAQAYGMDIVRFRPFFWIGPRKMGDAASDLARRVIAIERGAAPQLRVGRTDSVRDMIDVRDGISALVMLAERGVKGMAYNICCGHGTSIADIIAAYQATARTRFEVVPDADLLRPVDEPIRVGDPHLIFGLGWRPRITMNQALDNVLGFWRSQVEIGRSATQLI
jgi:GDP-4-dehydro-6-deoxy-D-mannose reductase